jgi:integrase
MTKSAGYIPQHCPHKSLGLGYVRLNGKMLYTGKWGSPEAAQEYDRLIHEWMANGRQLPSQPARRGEATIDDLVAAFWVHAEEWYRRLDGSQTGELKNIRYAVKPLRARYGRLPLARFGPRELKVYRESIIDAGLCRNVVNAQVGIVKRLFNWAVEEELVESGVAFALAKVRHLPRGRSRARESVKIKPVREADMQAVLPHVSRQVAAMIQLQWLTGMRPGEVVSMRTTDIDMSEGIWVYTPTHHKNEHHGTERFIPLGPKAQEIVRPHLKLDREAFLFSPRDADTELRALKARTRKTKVQPSQRARHARAMAGRRRKLNDRYSVVSYGVAIARACLKAEIPGWTANQLRHSAATRIRKQHGIEAARVVLGHNNLSTTEIYAEINREAAMRIMEQMG